MQKIAIGAPGLGSLRLEAHDDGQMAVRIRCRPPGHPLGEFHRLVIAPDEDPAARLEAAVPPESDWRPTDEHMDSVTIGDVIDGYVGVHRTPERLARWEDNKAEREAELKPGRAPTKDPREAPGG